MKKHVFGRKLKRDANERKALFKNLLTSLVLQERISTTEAKAKAIRSAADKLITKAKKAHSAGSGQGGDAAYRALHPEVNQEAVVKLISDLGPRFASRQGGYTRIIKIGKRRVSDNAPMVYMEWTEAAAVVVSDTPKTPAKKRAKTRQQAAVAAKAKKEAKAPKPEAPKPTVAKKVEEKTQQRPGLFKRLVTRQKKG